MSIKKTRNSSISEYSIFNKTSRDLPVQDISANYSNPVYRRNPSWPSITVNPGDNRIVGLYAVWPWDGNNSDNNFIALLCTTAYTVDFGDGSAPVNTATNVQVNYQYNYNNPALNGTDAPVTIVSSTNTVNRNNHGQQNSDYIQIYNLSAGTGIVSSQYYYVVNATTNTFQLSLTKNGSPITIIADGTGTLLPYKIAIVTITPQAGQNITTFSIQRKHNRTGWTNGISTAWLRIDIAAPSLTSIVSGTNNTTNSVRHNYLEEINFIETGIFTTYNSLFLNACLNLKRVYFSPTINASSVTIASSMFWGCASLIDLTLPTTLTNLTLTNNMFVNCRALVIPPEINTSQVTNAASMYSGCSSLRYIPPHDFSVCTTLASFANACTSLEYCSDLKTTNLLTTVSGMFTSCPSLKRAPIMDTSGVTVFASMFSACSLLEEVPSYNTSSGTDFSSMFVSASALKKVPRFNTSNGTNFSSMFSSCSSIREIPETIQLNSATVTTSMFLNCRALEKIHALNAPVLVTASTMFSGCNSLYRIEGLTTSSALTTINGMFTSCSSLKNVPLFNTSGVTNISSLFSACAIEEVPHFNTQSVTNFASMFINCLFIKSVPLFNTASATTMANMFEGCTALEKVPVFNTSNVTSMSGMFLNCTSLTEVPLFNTANVTNVTSMFSGCVVLREVPAYNFGAVTAANLGSLFLNCFHLQQMRATGIRFSFAIQSASLSSAALNEIYTNLPTVTGQIITVTSNYGIDGDNPAIATAKGWTVTGS